LNSLLKANLRQLRARELKLLRLARALPISHRCARGASMAVQATCGALLAYGISHQLHPAQAFWASITAIAVTQMTYVDTAHASRDQCIGAATGGLIGLAGVLIGGDTLITYMMVVALTILVCWLLNAGAAARLGAITATILTLVPHTGPAWAVAAIRLGQVALGTGCAIFVSYLAGKLEQRLMKPAGP
jgi:uncharacterized membrane protein YgaE (UPF0421/DUF939 family)